MDDGFGRLTTPTLLEYGSVLRRRWVVIVVTMAIVTTCALIATSLQAPRYAASADVLLSRQDLAAALTGTAVSPTWDNADRFMHTQSLLARLPEVASSALARAKIRDRTPGDLLSATKVTPVQNADLLTFEVSDRFPQVATALATAYAGAFTAYRRQLDQSTVERALAEVRRKLVLQGTDSPLRAALLEKEKQLRTLAALQTPMSLVVRPAGQAVKTHPRWKSNLVLGMIFGLILGMCFAFLWEALDKRVRRIEAIGNRLGGLPLLGRIPVATSPELQKNSLAMDPYGVHAEVFRILAMTLEMAGRHEDDGGEHSPRVIMATSAVEQEGKTTTLANLGTALAEAGRRVVLVDLDLRNPSLHHHFDIPIRPGTTDVVHEITQLESALKPSPLFRGIGKLPLAAGASRSSGSLHVLPCGSPVFNPTEFLGSKALRALLERLATRADYVLVDTSPLLRVGDGVALFESVDSLILVTRLGVLNRPMLDELDRLFSVFPGTRLGYIVTGFRVDDLFPATPYPHRPRQKVQPVTPELTLKASRGLAAARDLQTNRVDTVSELEQADVAEVRRRQSSG